MRALGNNPTHAEVNQLMARADVDHNGRLDIREFIRMMHNYSTETADPKAEDLQKTREIMEAFRCRRDIIYNNIYRYVYIRLGKGSLKKKNVYREFFLSYFFFI